MMTKAEKQQLADAQLEAKLHKVMRLYDPITPDILPPLPGQPCTLGWVFNSYNRTIQRTASSSVGHFSSWEEELVERWAVANSPGGTYVIGGSQGSRSLYSTKTLAYREMLAEVALESAKKLVEIQNLIDAEENKT